MKHARAETFRFLLMIVFKIQVPRVLTKMNSLLLEVKTCRVFRLLTICFTLL